jgi:non-ribosomal peptide synthetase component F
MKEEAPVEKGTDWVSGDWNRTERPFPRDRTLAVLFAEQAAATPDNLAVVSAIASTPRLPVASSNQARRSGYSSSVVLRR